MNDLDAALRRTFSVPPRTALTAAVALLAALAAAALAPGCWNEDEPPAAAAEPVAQVALPGVSVLVRRPGEMEFQRTDDQLLEAGATVKTEGEYLALNVLMAVQVEVSRFTELVLAGPRGDGGEEVLVLGLQKGEVRVNAVSYNRPVHLETPAGSVVSRHGHFTARVAAREDGTFQLEVEALSTGLVLANAHGQVELPVASRGLAVETSPPQAVSAAPPR